MMLVILFLLCHCVDHVNAASHLRGLAPLTVSPTSDLKESSKEFIPKPTRQHCSTPTFDHEPLKPEYEVWANRYLENILLADNDNKQRMNQEQFVEKLGEVISQWPLVDQHGVKYYAKGAKATVYGSVAQNLYVNGISDLDIVVSFPWEVPSTEVIDYLQTLNTVFDSGYETEIIGNEIPHIILEGQNIKADISIQTSNHSGLRALEFVTDSLVRYQGMREIVLLMKRYLFKAKLYDPREGTLTSYVLILMVHFFLSMQGAILNRYSLVEKLIRFLKTFSLDSPYIGRNKEMHMRPIECVFYPDGVQRNTPLDQQGEMFIQDPLCEKMKKNASVNVRNIQRVQQSFDDLYNHIVKGGDIRPCFENSSISLVEIPCFGDRNEAKSPEETNSTAAAIPNDHHTNEPQENKNKPQDDNKEPHDDKKLKVSQHISHTSKDILPVLHKSRIEELLQQNKIAVSSKEKKITPVETKLFVGQHKPQSKTRKRRRRRRKKKNEEANGNVGNEHSANQTKTKTKTKTNHKNRKNKPTEKKTKIRWSLKPIAIYYSILGLVIPLLSFGYLVNIGQDWEKVYDDTHVLKSDTIKNDIFPGSRTLDIELPDRLKLPFALLM